MSLLEQAITLATSAHEGQVDKAGKPYIFHPLRVMLSGTTEDEQIAGVLHDVVEDTWVTLDYLIEVGFPKHIVDAVDAVSKREGELYNDFIARSAKTYLSLRVKLLDIDDNMSPNRMLPEDNKGLLKRYEKAKVFLHSELEKMFY